MHVGRRGGRRPLSVVALLVAAAVAVAAWTAAGSTAANSKAAAPITDFVKYVAGKPGQADPNLAPAKIGWISNQDGSIVSIGPEATAGAQVAVDWINKHASGISGHPLVLDKCLIKNAEEEGLKCAQQFLNDDAVSVVSFGALSVGNQTVNSTIAGKKPVILGFSLSTADYKAKNVYALFVAGPFGLYPFGQFAATYLHAKTGAIIYPAVPGQTENAAAAKEAAVAAGIKVKLVGFNPKTSDLVGALTAAGAASADFVAPLVTTPANCLSAAKGIAQLGIKPNKVIWYTQCQQKSIKAQYPGGDYPKYYSGIAQSGDALINSPTGNAYKKALTEFGAKDFIFDDWYSGMFGQILTIAQFMNKIGFDNLSPERMNDQVKKFKGPLLLGGPIVQCGKYPSVPASCGDGNYFFRYVGNEKFVRVSGWVQPPLAIQKKFHARPPTG